jgi:cytochrome c
MHRQRFGLRWMAIAIIVLPVCATGSTIDGKEIYDRCRACHALEANAVGPKHCGLFGRKAGSASGFAFSDAMRQSRIVWSETTLDRFLSAPNAMVPGTLMTYAGVPDADERHALIAYLKAATVDSAICSTSASPAAKTAK